MVLTNTRVRALLIEDSPFMRKIISDILTSDEEIELVGCAADGKEGSELAMELKPDVVITDMVMPTYDGIYVVKSLMEKRPVPIILLSSLEKTNSLIFDGLANGAFEFIDKPAELDRETIKNYPLTNLVKQAAAVDVSTLKSHKANQNANVHTFTDNLNYDIVVIGASTGGPGAIEWIVTNLPKNLLIPVVIAQHMPARFLETFAQRLSVHSNLPVKMAHKGEALKSGTIYLAPGETNTRIDRSILSNEPIIVFTNREYREFNFPSIDCLFESAASAYGSRCIGVVLTGMGRDGVMGLTKIKEEGGYTIAQDEDSCVVYGMPKAAFDDGVVKKVVKLKEIPGFIVSCL